MAWLPTVILLAITTRSARAELITMRAVIATNLVIGSWGLLLGVIASSRIVRSRL